MTFPERIVPDETESGVVALHLKRYTFAEPYCSGKEVLDAACGVGYGSAHLGRVARRVVGVDLDEEAVEYARRRYGSRNVAFEVMDVGALRFADATFDVVCSFETIEHLADRDAHLSEVARVLRADGTYVVSTPRAERTTERPPNPFHRVEYDSGDFRALLERYFERVELYGQRRRETRRHRLLRRLDILGIRRRLALPPGTTAVLGSPPTSGVTLADIVIDRDGVERANELLAVCTGPRRR